MIDDKDRHIAALEATLADARRDWADAEAALVTNTAELAEARAALADAQARLDRLRLASLVLQRAAEQMVEATGGKVP